MLKLSIIVCTYNRSQILSECLQSLLARTIPQEEFEVIVVNNNSTDETEETVKTFTESCSNLQLVNEAQTGLSHARNRGWREAKADWIMYLDDDVKVRPDLIEVAVRTIKQESFDAFGGIYLPWYREGKKAWFKDEWASNSHWYGKLDRTRVLSGAEFFVGGVSVWKRSFFQAGHEFPANLGMTGNKIAYGEENYLQIKMEQEGLVRGIVPDLLVDHLVQPDRQSLYWLCRSRWALGRDLFIAGRCGSSLWRDFFKEIMSAMLCFPGQLKRLIKEKDYYIHNLLYDNFKYVIRDAGKIWTRSF